MRSILLLILSLFSAAAFAQKEGYIWYFGNNAGINFNTSPPTNLTNGALSTIEGCATICNRNGGLLFYTDGIRVYNKNHSQMANGSGLFGDPSSTQSGIIVPNPDTAKIYYVFSITGFTTRGLYYSVVDTSLNSGLGDVRAKNIPLMPPASTEKLNAVRHANGKDTWVVTHRQGNNSFYAYQVKGTGVDTTPVITSIGPSMGYSPGYLKFSPDGRKLVCADYFGTVELYDFNASTGVISNRQTLINAQNYYGVEFSPSGRFLYVTYAVFSGTRRLEQYDLNAGSLTNIINSRKIIASITGSYTVGALQLAPDGKIYMAMYSSYSHLGVINFPETADTACRFVQQGFALSPKSSSWGLPSFNQSFFRQIEVKINYKCKDDSTQLALSDTSFIDSATWYFNDASSSHLSAKGKTVSHVYSSAASFVSKVIVYRRVLPYIDSTTFSVVIKPRPQLITRSDTTICAGRSVNLTAADTVNSFTNFYWNNGLPNGSLHTVSPSTTTTYRIIGSAGCKVYEDTNYTTVYVRPQLDISLPADKVICLGDSVSLSPVTAGGDSTYTLTWNNSLGTGSSKTVKPSATTLYTVILSDACTVKNDTDDIRIFVRPALDVRLGNDTSICYGTSINLNPFASGGDSSYIFNWNNGLDTARNQTVSPTDTISYRVILSDACSVKNDTDEIVVRVMPPLSIALRSDSTICRGNSLTINASISGGKSATNGIVSWNQSLGTGISKTLSPDTTTTYRAVLTDGCSSPNDTDYLSIFVRPALDISLRADTTICRGNSVTLSSFVTGGDSSYTISWDNGLGTGSSKTVSPLLTTTYRAILEDGCTVRKDTAYVTVFVRNALNILLRSDTTICKGNSVTLQPLSSGGDSSYTLSWNNSLGTGSSKTVSPLSTTTYQVILSDACTLQNDTAEMTVYVRPALSGIKSNDTLICYGTQTTLSVLPAGGDSTYTVTWNNGLGNGLNKTVSPSDTTDYMAVISDGCTVKNDTLNIRVNVLPRLSLSLGADTTLCQGQSYTINATANGGISANYNISWNQGLGTGNSKLVNPVDSSTYTAILSDGCSSPNDTVSLRINVRDSIRIFVAADTAICLGDTTIIRAYASGGRQSTMQFTWDQGIGVNNFVLVNPPLTTTYKVRVSDGCTALGDSGTLTVYVKEPLNVNAGNDTTICIGGTADLKPVPFGGQAATYEYRWDQGLGSGRYKSASPTSTTTYRIILTDLCTNKEDTDFVTVFVRDPLQLILKDTTICKGQQFISYPKATGGDSSYTFEWNQGLGNGDSMQLGPLSTNTYQLIVSDGCTSRNDTASFTVFVRPELDVKLRPDTTICIGNAVLLSPLGSGGDSTYTFTWNNGLGNGATKNVQPSVTSTYRVIISDACTVKDDTTEMTIWVRPALNLNLRSDTTICQGNAVDLSAMAEGGDSSYTFTWNNGLGNGANKTVAPMTTSTYRSILSDGCTIKNDTAFITVFVRPALNLRPPSDTTICFGNSLDLTAFAEGGDSSYNFTWNHGLGSGSTKTVSPDSNRTYNIILSDACTKKDDTASVRVFVRAPLKVSLRSDTVICAGNSVLLAPTGQGGDSTYTFNWDNGLGSGAQKTVSTDITTTYRVIIDDACTSKDDTAFVTLFVRPFLKAKLRPDTTICQGNSVEFAAAAEGGDSSYIFSWDNGLGDGATKTPAPMATTTYRLVLSDECTVKNDTLFRTVFVRPPLDINFEKDTVICLGQQINLQPDLGGGDSSYTVVWNNGLGNGLTKLVQPSSSTNYRAIIRDNCTVKEDTAFIQVDVRDPLSVNLKEDTVICYGQSIDISASASGGRQSSWLFTWNNGLGTGATKTIQPLDTTTYRVILSDACTVLNDSAEIIVKVRPALEVYAGRDTLICEGQSVTLIATGKHGKTDAHSFSWKDLGAGASHMVSPLISTLYVVTLSDNCSSPVNDTVAVNIEGLPDVLFHVSDSFICVGDSVRFTNLSSGPGASYKYTWRFGDGRESADTSPKYLYKKDGLYDVTLILRSPLGCIDSLMRDAYMQVNPNPVAAFITLPPFADYSHPEIEIENKSKGADFYVWNFGDGSGSFEEHPDHKYEDTGWYPITLIAGTNNQCFDTISKLFQVKDVYHFYIPSAFSPNGDGDNEVFKYSGRGYTGVSTRIFNRWGELVFESTKPGEFWNGALNNQGPLLAEGVYSYNIVVRDFRNGFSTYNGTLTLIK